MPDLSLDLDKAMVNALFARLDRASAVATIRRPLQRGAERIHKDLVNYPPPSGKPNPPKSAKQRRYLAMLGRMGLLPYRRTMTLASSWAVDFGESQNLAGFEISSSATSPSGFRYGPLVMGDGTQSAYHQGTWATVGQVFGAHAEDIADDVLLAIDEALG